MIFFSYNTLLFIHFVSNNLMIIILKHISKKDIINSHLYIFTLSSSSSPWPAFLIAHDFGSKNDPHLLNNVMTNDT